MRWIEEWRLVNKVVIKEIDSFHVWFWDGQEHVDPMKEANAQRVRLESRTTTLATEYARQGKDWETELRQIAKEQKLMDELGIAQQDVAKPQTKEDEEDENE